MCLCKTESLLSSRLTSLMGSKRWHSLGLSRVCVQEKYTSQRECSIHGWPRQKCPPLSLMRHTFLHVLRSESGLCSMAWTEELGIGTLNGFFLVSISLPSKGQNSFTDGITGLPRWYGTVKFEKEDTGPNEEIFVSLEKRYQTFNRRSDVNALPNLHPTL